MRFILKHKILVLLLLISLILAAVFYIAGKKSNKQVLENVDIVIQNAVVVTLDADSHIYRPGYLIIKDDKILALGSGAAPKQYLAKKNINAQGKVILPGLVNTHTHAAMSLLDSLGQGQDLATWLNTMSTYESKLNSDQVYWGALLAETKMIKTGTTIFNDMYFYPEATEKSATDIGMRAIVRVSSQATGTVVTFQQDSLTDNPLINFSIAPNPLLDYSVAELSQFADYASAHNLPIHIHFEEDQKARANSVYKFSLTPLELIRQTGLINNKIILAHSVDVTAEEIQEMAQYPNIGISFNPISEFKLQTPLTPVASFLNNNVLVGFGTDGEPSSNLSLFEQMKFAASGYLNCSSDQKYCADGKTIDSEKIIRMATIDGAKVLGLDNKIGSLEAGKQADLIVVDIKDIANVKDIYQALVYTVNDGDVVDTIIGGKIIMENRKLLTINEWDILDRAEKISTSLKTINITY